MVKIITDSTCDLGIDRMNELDLEVIKLPVNFGEETYYDLVDINTDKLYELVKEKNMLPKTSAVPIMTYIDVFQKYVDLGYDIVFMGISRQMSRSFENAIMAAREVNEEKIFVVDSMNLSTGIGLLLLKACKYRDQGDDAKTIAEKLNVDNKRVLSQFAIEKMNHLHKGGRCSSVAAIAASILKIKPIIAVRDGKMHVMKKPIGKMKTALDIMIKQIIQDKDRLDKEHIFITNSHGKAHSDYIYEQLKNEFPDVDIICTDAGCVISTHCGEGTCGILYMINE